MTDHFTGWIFAPPNRRMSIYGAEQDVTDKATLNHIPGAKPFKINGWPLVAFKRWGVGPVACLVRFDGDEYEVGDGRNGPVARGGLGIYIIATMESTELLHKVSEKWLSDCFGSTGFHVDVETYLLNAIQVRRNRMTGVNQLALGSWTELLNGIISLVAQYTDVVGHAKAAGDNKKLLQENKRLNVCKAVAAFMNDDLVESVNAVLTAYLAVKTSDAILTAGREADLSPELFSEMLAGVMREENERFDVMLRGAMEKSLGREMMEL